jgi:hypothetical protein
MRSLDFVSSLGYALKWPLYSLLERLLEAPHAPSGSSFTNPVENGFATASVILTVVVLESAIGRAHYILRARPAGENDRLLVLPYFETLIDERGTTAAVREVFSLRDALVHNHLWIQGISAETFEPTSLPSFLSEWYGDRKYYEAVNVQAGRTKQLGLNVNPTSVDTGDVRRVLRAVADAGMALEMKVQEGLGFTSQDAPFRGKQRTFLDVTEMF